MSVDKRFFSIIIPLYNKEVYIEKTIACVINQTYEHFEVIIVDDGSTDSSLIRAKTLAAQDERISVYNKSNGGVSSARNFGIGKARYPYIAFLDADDQWEKNYLEEMNALIARYPDCGMYGCAYKKVKHNKVIYNCRDIPEGIIEDYFRTIIYNIVAWTSALIVKRDVFKRVGLFPVGMIGGEDYFMWTKIAINYKMAFTPQVLATYNLYLGSISSRIGKMDCSTESWFDFYQADDFYRNEFIANKALDNGIRHAWGSHKLQSKVIEIQFRYTKLFRHKWMKLFLLNRLPQPLLFFLLFCKKTFDPLYTSSARSEKQESRKTRKPQSTYYRPATSVRTGGLFPKWFRSQKQFQTHAKK